jgi:hypothetical protein
MIAQRTGRTGRFAGFLNHLISKVKLFVKNKTRVLIKLDHESRMLIPLFEQGAPHPSILASRQLPPARGHTSD